MGDVDYGGFVGLKTDLQILNGFVGLKADLQLLEEICRPEGRVTFVGVCRPEDRPTFINDRPTIAGRGLLV